jgi:argininosuccinate lyase
VVATVLGNVRLNEERARASASRGYMNATELADYMVRKGLPFREAHDTVGKIVLLAIRQGAELEALTLEELRSFSPLIEEDVFAALSLDETLATKAQPGGTSPARVSEALAEARASLEGERHSPR